MKRLDPDLLRRMAERLDDHDRDEMAIPSYLHPNPALRWMAWRRLEVVLQHLDQVCTHRDRANTTLLDYGCGTGVLFRDEERKAATVIGVDLVLQAAELLLEDSGQEVQLWVPEQAEQQIEDHSIDVIVAAEVLEHIEPVEPTLATFRRWLAPGGRLIVSLPTEGRLYRFGRRLAGFDGHYHHSNAASIDAAIQSQGFAPVQRDHVPLPGPGAIYWVHTYAP